VTDTSHWRWHPKKLLVVAVLTSLVSLPVLAEEANQPTPATPSLRASAAKIVASEVLKLASDVPEATPGSVPSLRPSAFLDTRAGVVTPAAARRAQQGGAPDTESAGFFKTRVGIVAVAVLAAGVGYALYSTQHDRVSSPGKK